MRDALARRAAISLTFVALMALMAAACGTDTAQKNQGDIAEPAPSSAPTSAPAKPSASDKDMKGGTVEATPPGDGLAVATFAGGCFWCLEPPFEKLPGVKDAVSGYTGGEERHPSYKQVAYGLTGHTEAVQVIYDPKVIGYKDLVEVFWRTMDPTDNGGQFVDRGSQYRPGIFVQSDEERAIAAASKEALAGSGVFKKPIVVPIEDAAAFWIAEEYHQDFYKKNSAHYKRYRRGSGRDAFVTSHWGEEPLKTFIEPK